MSRGMDAHAHHPEPGAEDHATGGFLRQVRRWGACVAAALASLVALAGGATPAAADAPVAYGWWWRVRSGPLVVTPPPPNVPPDALVVGGAPDGATAVGALRFELAPGAGSPVLTLKVAEDVGGVAAEMAACPTGSPWSPALAGAWEEKPTAACSRGSVQGVRSDDGAAWTFAVAPLLVDGVVDVVIVPSEGSTFQLTFESPGADALTATPGTAPDAPPPAPPFDPAAAPEPSRSNGFAPFVPALPPADQEITAVAPGLAAPPEPDVATPRRGRSTVSSGAPDGPRPRTARGVALAVLAASVAAGVLAVVRGGAGKSAGPAPHALARGIGRFARPRTGAPPPIV